MSNKEKESSEVEARPADVEDGGQASAKGEGGYAGWLSESLGPQSVRPSQMPPAVEATAPASAPGSSPEPSSALGGAEGEPEARAGTEKAPAEQLVDPPGDEAEEPAEATKLPEVVEESAEAAATVESALDDDGSPPGRESGGPSLTPEVVSPTALDPEDLSVLPGRGRKRWLGLSPRLWALVAAVLLALLFLGRSLTQRAHETPTADRQQASEGRDQPLAIAAPPPAPAPEMPGAEASGPGEEPPPAASAGSPLLAPGAAPASSADPASPDAPRSVGPSGPAVARFPDLPREVLEELEREAKAKRLKQEQSAPLPPPPTEAKAPVEN